MLMKLKSLLLSAAAAVAVSANADRVKVADFLSVANEDGTELTPLEKGLEDGTVVAFVYNKVETDINSFQVTLKFPEGVTPKGNWKPTDDTKMYDEDEDDYVQLLTNMTKFADAWKSDSREYTVIAVNGSQKIFTEGKSKLRIFTQKLIVDADAADGLEIVPTNVVWSKGGSAEDQLEGPTTPIKITSVRAIEADKEVAGVKYYNVAGVESDRPFQGVNIVVTRYNDGSMTTTKLVK